MTVGLLDLWDQISVLPLIWVTVTLLAYLIAYAIYRRSGMNPLANPVLISVTIIVCVLQVTRTPYEKYFEGAQLVHFLVGPATVALAVPLYAQVERLKSMLVPMLIALLVGSLTAIASAVAIAWVFGASPDILLSLAPKSSTMPIAMGVSEKIGGVPSLTALAVAMTGVSGAIMARGVLGLIRIQDPAVRGFAIGLTAHAIGTAHALQVSQVAGAFSALAMGLNGVTSALLLPFLVHLVQR